VGLLSVIVWLGGGFPPAVRRARFRPSTCRTSKFFCSHTRSPSCERADAVAAPNCVSGKTAVLLGSECTIGVMNPSPFAPEQCVAAVERFLKDLAAAHGRMPETASQTQYETWQADHADAPSRFRIIRALGSWPEALAQASSDTKPARGASGGRGRTHKRAFNDAQCKAALHYTHRLAAGEPLTMVFYDAHHLKVHPSSDTVSAHHGGWLKALRSAGIEPTFRQVLPTLNRLPRAVGPEPSARD
jgi:hypothetical protein